jgi:hypothetical protein
VSQSRPEVIRNESMLFKDFGRETRTRDSLESIRLAVTTKTDVKDRGWSGVYWILGASCELLRTQNLEIH